MLRTPYYIHIYRERERDIGTPVSRNFDHGTYDGFFVQLRSSLRNDGFSIYEPGWLPLASTVVRLRYITSLKDINALIRP